MNKYIDKLSPAQDFLNRSLRVEIDALRALRDDLFTVTYIASQRGLLDSEKEAIARLSKLLMSSSRWTPLD